MAKLFQAGVIILVEQKTINIKDIGKRQYFDLAEVTYKVEVYFTRNIFIVQMLIGFVDDFFESKLYCKHSLPKPFPILS